MVTSRPGKREGLQEVNPVRPFQKRQSRLDCHGRPGVLGLLFCFMVFQALSSLSAQQQDDPSFYGEYAAVLDEFVSEQGMVDYQKLKAEPENLRAFLRAMATIERETYTTWTDDGKIAFWINAYNACTLKAIIDHYPIKARWTTSLFYPDNSIRQIDGVWDELEFSVLGKKRTLDEIEHETLREEFNEPRIHMALVCAAKGCPVLRNEPYFPSRLDAQLDDQTRRFLRDPDKFRIDRDREEIYLSSIFKWFGDDFIPTYSGQSRIAGHSKKESAVLRFVAQYLDEPDRDSILTGDYSIEYLDYDWTLNEQK